MICWPVTTREDRPERGEKFLIDYHSNLVQGLNSIRGRTWQSGLLAEGGGLGWWYITRIYCASVHYRWPDHAAYIYPARL